jgi:hypothetical protein
MATATISDPILSILREATVVGQTLYLNAPHLDRKLYLSVNKVLEPMSGKLGRAQDPGLCLRYLPRSGSTARRSRGNRRHAREKPISLFPHSAQRGQLHSRIS